MSDRFISVSINSYEYNGGTHGWNETHYLNVDLEHGKAAELEDFFELSRLTRVIALCRQNFHSSNPEEIELDARDAEGKAISVSQNFRRVVLDPDNWSFSKTRAHIRFGIGDLGGGYAQGEQFCTLRYADLRPLLRPGKVLPP
ncbi:MAG: hypothetical protein JO216_16820 [Hyphomicrobiales bacterium]|nr:hypothetical protein [Hyphomicrobiales bacterium]